MEALFADGGCVGRNPSQLGGTFAWCVVNGGELVRAGSGVIVSTVGGDASYGTGPVLSVPITNNIAEYWAVLDGLEHLPDGWSGKVHSDSQVTLGRFFEGWRLSNIPPEWSKRRLDAINRLGYLTPILLKGHPSPESLARGVGSRHQVWCDERCTTLGAEYMRHLRGAPERTSHAVEAHAAPVLDVETLLTQLEMHLHNLMQTVRYHDEALTTLYERTDPKPARKPKKALPIIHGRNSVDAITTLE